MLLKSLKSSRHEVLALVHSTMKEEAFITRDVQHCHQRLSSAFDRLLFFLAPTLTTPPNNALLANLDLYMQRWQSRVEVKGYSVAYFDRITAFEGLYRLT